eukprot:6432775-Pyramimonas_sp.AAC.1
MPGWRLPLITLAGIPRSTSSPALHRLCQLYLQLPDALLLLLLLQDAHLGCFGGLELSPYALQLHAVC